MPLPLIPIAIGIGTSIAAGYIIDQLVGDGIYTKEEALLDGTLGLVGGGVVGPSVRIGNRFRKTYRAVGGRASTIEKYVYGIGDDVLNTTSAGAKAGISLYVTVGSEARSFGRLAKFAVVSGTHSYLTGSGTPGVSTNPYQQAPVDINKYKNPQLRSRKPASHYGTPKSQSKKAKVKKTKFSKKKFTSKKGKKKYTSKKGCPPGHYWSPKQKKCVKYWKR